MAEEKNEQRAERIAARLDDLAETMGRAGLWHSSAGASHGESVDGGEVADVARDGARAIRQYESAWRAVADPLAWMQGSKALGAYLGMNLADIANDLIDRAYPGLRAGLVQSPSEIEITNVEDRHRGWIGPWIAEAEPIDTAKLTEADIGRKLIYRAHHRNELGILINWRSGVVYARYHQGSTAAGAQASDLHFAIRDASPPRCPHGYLLNSCSDCEREHREATA